MVDLAGVQLDGSTVVVLVLVGAVHSVLLLSKIARFFASEVRSEVFEWKKWGRGG
jgi:hypothetical protein